MSEPSVASLAVSPPGPPRRPSFPHASVSPRESFSHPAHDYPRLHPHKNQDRERESESPVSVLLPTTLLASSTAKTPPPLPSARTKKKKRTRERQLTEAD
jgi:hypothetical protein